MLVLTRKQLQQIVIGRDIRITIVKLERNQVRLGIEAPRGMTILREELIARDDQENGSEQVGNARSRSRTSKRASQNWLNACADAQAKDPSPGPSRARGRKIAALPRSEGEFRLQAPSKVAVILCRL